MTEYDIIDYETDEVVATVTDDGELATDDEAVAELAREMSEEGGIEVLTTGGGVDEVHAYGEWRITPEDEGFIRAFHEYLPSPYEVDPEQLSDVEQYKPPRKEEPVVDELVKFDRAEKAAESALQALLSAASGEENPDDSAAEPLSGTDNGSGGEEGNEDTAEKAADAALTAFKSSAGTLTKEEYEAVDDALYRAHERVVWWDGDDLSKAPPAWDSDADIPDFVVEAIREVIGEGVLWDEFEGYSKQAARAIHNSLEENLTQPQGWSVGSIVDDIREMYSGMAEEKALNIVQTELSAVFNRAREKAYKERADSEEYLFYWGGPDDHRTTKVCESIKERVEERGGSVPMEVLRSILKEYARKYQNTSEGGTPKRVDSWVPHYRCRHALVRDVRSTL